MEFIKRIVHVLSNICYVFIGIYALICAPMIFGYKPLVVLSGSMEPNIKTGSVIYYHKVNKEDLKVGDIITFKTDTKKEYVSHRINAIDGDSYETKGDANNAVDPLKITYEDIIGKDLNINIPYAGYYIDFANKHVYLIIVVAIILISEYLLTNAFDIKEKEGEKHGTKEKQ